MFDDNEKDEKLPLSAQEYLVESVALATGLAFGGLIYSPLDRIQSVLYVAIELPRHFALGNANKICRFVFNTEGVLGFWRTLGIDFAARLPPCYLNAPFSPLNRRRIVTALEESHCCFRATQQDAYALVLAKNVVARTIAGCLPILVTHPLRIVAFHTAVDLAPHQYTLNPLPLARSIVDKNGVLGLWSGVGVAMASLLIYNTISIGLSDCVALRMEKLKKSSSTKTAKLWTSCAVSVMASLAAYPFDKVEALMMLRAGTSAIQYGAIATIRRVVDARGVSAMYAGFSLTVLRTLISRALTLIF